MDPISQHWIKSASICRHTSENQLPFLLQTQARDAIQDLLGGEDQVDEKCSSWGDSSIVNLGIDELEPQELDNWHVYGGFFIGDSHYTNN